MQKKYKKTIEQEQLSNRTIEYMKIAIATNDRINVAKRTGQAKEFALIEIENGKVISQKYAANHHEHHDDEEEHEHSHDDIVKILKDIDVLLLLNVGGHLKKDLEEGNIKYEKTKLKTLEEVITKWLNG